MILSVLITVAGGALILAGVTAPAPWAGTLIGLALAVIGYVRIGRELEDRREARRRERRPGYITRRD